MLLRQKCTISNRVCQRVEKSDDRLKLCDHIREVGEFGIVSILKCSKCEINETQIVAKEKHRCK